MMKVLIVTTTYIYALVPLCWHMVLTAGRAIQDLKVSWDLEPGEKLLMKRG